MPNIALGDRMKLYENQTRNLLVRGVPVILRLDGRAFHTFLSEAEKPFDTRVGQSMLRTARELFDWLSGCKLAYTQSDEVSFLITDYDRVATDALFGYNIQKLVSTSASLFSIIFSEKLEFRKFYGNGYPTFDARVFNIPLHEVWNYFLWRARDCEKNSLGAYCLKFFSHKELEGKNAAQRHEMLHGIEKNWSTDPEMKGWKRNGVFLTKEDAFADILPKYKLLRDSFQHLLPMEPAENLELT